MMRMNYRQGDTLFRQGDPSDFALRVLGGELDVVVEMSGHGMVVGRVGVGDYVGEMGVIEKKPRSATVRAATDVAVEVIPAEVFLNVISQNSTAALDLLSRISDKLRTVSQELAHYQLRTEQGDGVSLHPPPPLSVAPRVRPASLSPSAPSPVAPGPGPAAVAARSAQAPHPTPLKAPVSAKAAPAPPVPAPAPAPVPASPSAPAVVAAPVLEMTLPDFLGNAVKTVTRFPFIVGRDAPYRSTTSNTAQEGLWLPDQRPFRLSAPHFAIEQAADVTRFQIRDLSSELGTNVNGEFLGGFLPRDLAFLKRGANRIVAGGADSPFVFWVHVRP